jgi:hypothetical protein
MSDVHLDQWAYEDFGVRTLKNGRRNPRARARPHCDLCGPFAGRYMRKTLPDEHGEVWRCKGCDDE